MKIERMAEILAAMVEARFEDFKKAKTARAKARAENATAYLINLIVSLGFHKGGKDNGSRA